MSNVLVWPDDDHTAFVAINAPHLENFPATFRVSAERLLVVDKSVPSLARQEKCRHALERKDAM
jgi:hypothetical protein